MKKMVCCIFLLLILSYLTIYLTVFPVTLRSIAIFQGKQVDIEDCMTFKYRWEHLDESVTRSIKILPYFVMHNFSKGRIWVYYVFTAYDKSGKLVGASSAPAQWNIQHTKNGWEVYEILEAP